MTAATVTGFPAESGSGVNPRLAAAFAPLCASKRLIVFFDPGGLQRTAGIRSVEIHADVIHPAARVLIKRPFSIQFYQSSHNRLPTSELRSQRRANHRSGAPLLLVKRTEVKGACENANKPARRWCFPDAVIAVWPPAGGRSARAPRLENRAPSPDAPLPNCFPRRKADTRPRPR